MRIHSLFTTIFTSFSIITVQAEVITDGTLGHSVNLPGPDFQISADLGQQLGGNLFHSFQDFNLQNHESATFSGPNSVQNVISRVTGGNPSTIDGLIRSTIPNADLYFLNPYGILFGPNAKLDIQGGFHASTADYLRLQDGGRFDARTPNNRLLTVAPIAAFGFLTDSPASITVEDNQLGSPVGKTFSLIGGNLHLNASEFRFNVFFPRRYEPQLTVPSGRINLVSLATRGEVVLVDSNIHVAENTKGGQIETYNSWLDVSGFWGQGGQIFVYGDSLNLKNTVMSSDTLSENPGGSINIQVNKVTLRGIDGNFSGIYANTWGAGKAGSISLRVDQLDMSGGTQIATASLGDGNSGSISIKATDTLAIAGKFMPMTDLEKIGFRYFGNEEGLLSGIFADSFQLGDGGNVDIQANQILLKEGGRISTSVTRQHGNISIKTGKLEISGEDQAGSSSATLTTAYGDSDASRKGYIHIDAQDIILTKGGFIGSDAFGTAQGGEININVENSIFISGKNKQKFNSGIFTNSVSRELSGKQAGNIYITAHNITLEDAGVISSSTFGYGNGGAIFIKVGHLLKIYGQQLDADRAFNNSAILSVSDSEQPNAGDAGEITIEANRIELMIGGIIATETKNATGGNIQIVIPNLFLLSNGQITTSVTGGTGSGGNITIEKPQFLVLNKGQIKAQADAGNGGNIRIIAEQFIPSADSLISASSQKGISGEVIINSPENNIGNNLVILGTKSLNADQVKMLCSKQRAGDKPSRFVVTPLAGYPPSPEDEWQTSSLKE